MDKFVERRWSNLLCIKQEEHYFICSRHCARKAFIMRKTILDDGVLSLSDRRSGAGRRTRPHAFSKRIHISIER